ncbi:MAG TPA: hypothetical protein PLU94_02055 [Methanoregulaceae archaeon]|nr:hypothetical protein [Methanoregulaceae archaeon]HPM62480.1 hypothetical protein [Methanoregulaceae archaeon]
MMHPSEKRSGKRAIASLIADLDRGRSIQPLVPVTEQAARLSSES